MTAPATLPDTAPPGAGDGDDVEHLYHCDPNRSLCGLDIADYEDLGETDEPGDICPLCEAVSELGLPCGPDCEGGS